RFHRRCLPLHRLRPSRPPAVPPGSGRLRHLPVPLGVERPPGGAGVPRHRLTGRHPHRPPQRVGGQPRPGVALVDRRRLRHDGRPRVGLPLAPASLRPRPAGRVRQGMNADRHLMIAFEGTEPPPDTLALLAEGNVAGVTLFNAANVRDAGQVADLTAALRDAAPEPILVATDQEGGQLMALGPDTTPFAGAMALGATGDPDLARRVARAIGTELRALGVDLNYAPVCDVATNPNNPSLGTRSFSDDPALVAE